MTPSRVDSNQHEIVDALRKAGASVHSCHKIGQGFPDLCVGFRGDTYLLEVKTSGGMLNLAQCKWHAGWRGQVAVVYNAHQALRVIGVVE